MIDTQILNNNKIRITLNNNPVNSISKDMLYELDKVINNIDFSKIKAIYFDSKINHFCAGADLKERSKFSKDETISFLEQINNLFDKISDIQIPTFAFINGGCLGGGLEFALACDFRIGFDNSFYGFPETSIGIIPGAGGTQRLTRLIGSSKSLKWIFTANRYTSEDALEDGVIDFVIDFKDKDKFMSTFIEKIINNAPIAISAAKNSIKSSFIDHGFMCERKEYIKTLYSQDRDEGLLSFKEKRTPSWKNK